MGLTLTVVDAFTDNPFSGNPAAVAIADRFPDDEWMQAVAREMSLSETAFVVPRGDGSHDLRWFTPSVEVDLCGHATLASAHVLGRRTAFHTRSGVLACTPADDGWIEMDFPAVGSERDDPPVSLGVAGVCWYGQTGSDILIELEDAAAVRSLRVDLARLAALGSRGVLFTASGDRDGIDCVSRFFAPNVGIPEDPVTGSAHCSLAVFWGQRTGRQEMIGEQASARGGIVRMRREGDRVVLGGRAVSVSEVRLLV